jgi:hypothetical protein
VEEDGMKRRGSGIYFLTIAGGSRKREGNQEKTNNPYIFIRILCILCV